MGLYFVDEAAFEIEDGAFEDRTVNVLAARNDRPGDVSLLVSRTPLRAGESLLDVVTRHVERERRAFKAWQRLEATEGRVGDAPVLVLSVRWRGEAGLVYQRQAHVGLARRVLLIAATGPIAERGACDTHLERALRTFRARED